MKTDTTVELFYDSAWNDITADYVYTRDPIKIGRGRANESTQVEASECSMTLKNIDGRFSPRNPSSPLYGKIGRNTPVRVLLPGRNALQVDGTSGDYASTPDAAALDITGDLELQVDVTFTQGETGAFRELISKYLATGNQRSWTFRLTTTNTIQIAWTTDGTLGTLTALTTTRELSLQDGQRVALRVVLDVDNGASGRTAYFYTAATMGDPWTLFETVTASGTTSIHSGSANVNIPGTDNGTLFLTAGAFHAAKVISDPLGTPAEVANPDFAAEAAQDTSFADDAGRTWTVNGSAEIAALTTPRFTGEVAVWPQHWNKPGTDVYTPVEAAGIMRRLGQGASPLRSVARNAIEASGPVAYWVLDDGKHATQAAAVVGDPARITTVSPDVEFANTQPAPWLETLPKFTDGSFNGKVSMPGFTDEWGMGSIVVPSGTANNPFLAAYYAESAGWMNIGLYMPSTSIIRSYWTFHPDSGGTTGADFDWTVPADFLDGEPHWWELHLFQNGANIEHEVYVDGVALSLSSGTGVMTGRTLGAVYRAFVGGEGDDVLGHFAVWDDLAAMDGVAVAALGNPGETAGRRIERLCSEQGVPFTAVGDLDDTAAMGPQPIDTFLDVLRECADADGGVLYEPRDSLGLAYRTRTSMYNQTPALALDYDGGVFGSLPEPVDDDQATRNDVTVKRPEGSQARAILEEGPLSIQPPPDGVGTYDTSSDVNVVGDGFLPDQASWRLALGTVDEARYPKLHVNLAAPAVAADAALTADLAALDLGDRITVDNPPAWLPPDTISVLAQGFAETIGNNTWDIEVNCTPESPWQVGEYESAEGGTYRYDTAGSSLAAQFVAGTDTSMSVAVDIKPLWTTDGDEVPFDINVGGVRLTVTAISGATSPQTFTITQAPVNGITKTIPAGTSVSLWTKARYAL